MDMYFGPSVIIYEREMVIQIESGKVLGKVTSFNNQIT